VGETIAREQRLESRTVTWPDEQRFDSLQDLINGLGELIIEAQKAGHRWIYRGQPRASWELEPTIERRLPNVSTSDSESHLLWDFKRLAASLSDRVPDFSDNPSWFALMRHHGAPTRLLDWTDSCYVALFFACDEEKRRDDDKDQNSSVWALNASILFDKMKEQIARIIPDSAWESLDLSSTHQFDAVALHAFNYDAYKDEGLIAELPPRSSNSRMAFQQGTFLINCNHKVTFAESLKKMMNSTSSLSKPWVRKLVFPWTLREEIWAHLYERNVHPFTLFPDLDGLGRLLKLKNHVYWSRPKPIL